MIENDEWRRQRRLVVVLFGQTVSIEAPRLQADILNCLERVAATQRLQSCHFMTLES